MRERIVFGIMVLVLLFLFAAVFYVLGKGKYEPPTQGGGSLPPSGLVA